MGACRFSETNGIIISVIYFWLINFQPLTPREGQRAGTVQDAKNSPQDKAESFLFLFHIINRGSNLFPIGTLLCIGAYTLMAIPIFAQLLKALGTDRMLKAAGVLLGHGFLYTEFHQQLR